MFGQAGKAATGSLGRVVSTAGGKNLATAVQKFGQNAKIVGENVAKNMAHDMSGTELFKHVNTLTSSNLTMFGGLAAIGAGTKAGIAMTKRDTSNEQLLNELGLMADAATVASSVPGGAPAILAKVATIVLTNKGKYAVNNDELLRGSKNTLQGGINEGLESATNEILKFLKEIQLETPPF